MITERPWGKFELLKQDNGYWVKILTIKPKQRLSLQSHKNREEIWIVIKGKATVSIASDRIPDMYYPTEYHLIEKASFFVRKELKHRIANDYEEDLIVCEIALGKPDEDDIKRFDDDYGRD